MAAKMVKTQTPGIYKRGSRYVFSYRVNGEQRWESARTLDEARKAKQARATDIERGEFQERSRITLHAYALEWIDRYQGRGRRGFRENTRREYRRVLNEHVLDYFPAQMRLIDVTPLHVSKFIDHLCDPAAQGKRAAENRRKAKAEKLGVAASALPLTDDGKLIPPVALSDSTVRNIVAPLRACLTSAVREGLIRSSPARDVDLPHRPTVEDDEEEVRAMSRRQLDDLLGHLSNEWRLLFRFLASTGLRVSEAIALEWRHLDLDGLSPHVKVRHAIVRGGEPTPPKSRHGRRDVPLSHSLAHALTEQRRESEWPRDTDLVFPAGNGRPLMPGNVRRRVLKPAAEAAGVPWVGFHAFRHTCATMLFGEGRNAVQVQRWLGHHSAAFTLSVYVHLLDGDLGAPLEVGSANKVQTGPTPLDATRPEPEEAKLAA